MVPSSVLEASWRDLTSWKWILPGAEESGKTAGSLIRDHWLTGAGLGTFPDVIRVYQSHLTDQFAIVHAHNDYLELAGDLGVPVATAMALLVWGYWWDCARRLLRESALAGNERGARSSAAGNSVSALDRDQLERRRLLALGALAGSAAFLCHSWVEFNWQIPANQLYFLVLLVLMKFQHTSA